MSLIIAANWKMHKTAAEAADFCRTLMEDEGSFSDLEVVVCPPFTALSAVAAILQGSSLKLGAQNMHYEDNGAYTGEIAASMLIEHGVEYVIIGHSERRQLLGEDDRMIRLKVAAALGKGLKPILCVGETEEERGRGLTEAVLETQLKGALAGISPKSINELVVAYEPVWAIGSGKAASESDAEKAADLIHRYFRDKLGEVAAAGLRVQYGGSVKADNIGSYLSRPVVGGALVGGASLEAPSFRALLMAAGKAV